MIIERKIVTSYPVQCYGVEGCLARQGLKPVTASVTIYENGDRAVGCGYLGYNPASNPDRCSAGIDVNCPHLKPQQHLSH